ncbi:MAG: hypothetical protein NBV68_02900 [Erythrobacter sp.]|nr:hypothetical protein [Erythrobacter sp.]
MLDFAILAPVPSNHLVSGLQHSAKHGRIAYGTNKWEWLREVERDRDGEPVPVLIYSSHEGSDADLSCVVAWIAKLVASSEKEKEIADARPPSTATDGKWASFWLVEDLKQLPKEDALPISAIQTTAGGWRKESPPRGPERVELPASLSHYF